MRACNQQNALTHSLALFVSALVMYCHSYCYYCVRICSALRHSHSYTDTHKTLRSADIFRYRYCRGDCIVNWIFVAAKVPIGKSHRVVVVVYQSSVASVVQYIRTKNALMTSWKNLTTTTATMTMAPRPPPLHSQIVSRNMPIQRLVLRLHREIMWNTYSRRRYLVCDTFSNIIHFHMSNWSNTCDP